MVDFSLWDIFRNLLLAARWTVALSLIAFVGGGLVGMALAACGLIGYFGLELSIVTFAPPLLLATHH